MTAITPTIKLHTRAEGGGIHINSMIMKHNGNRYHLYGGTKDTIHVFNQSIVLYVLTINREYGAIGLNAYMSREPYPINTFCLHTLQNIQETLGANWELLSPKAITMKLINYLI